MYWQDSPKPEHAEQDGWSHYTKRISLISYNLLLNDLLLSCTLELWLIVFSWGYCRTSHCGIHLIRCYLHLRRQHRQLVVKELSREVCREDFILTLSSYKKWTLRKGMFLMASIETHDPQEIPESR